MYVYNNNSIIIGIHKLYKHYASSINILWDFEEMNDLSLVKNTFSPITRIISTNFVINCYYRLVINSNSQKHINIMS